MKNTIDPFKLIERNNCVVCESSDLEDYKTLCQFPIYMGVTEQSIESDVCIDQKWFTCGRCYCLQLKNLVPLDVLYSVNHSVEAVGDIWKNHHREFAKIIVKNSPANICEIGGSHGYLAKLITNYLPDVRYLMIEPSPTFSNNRVEIIKGFFEDNAKSIFNFKTIVNSHVLEHLYDPVLFLNSLHRYINNSAIIYISIPNINELLLKFGANALNFEHTFFLNLENLDFLANKTGFEITGIQTYLDHSFFITMKKAKKNLPDIVALKSANKLNLKNFDLLWDGLGQYVERAKLVINQKPHIPTFIFGAHVFAQNLYYLGLNKCKIEGILDNATMKVGKRLYGTPYKVFHPEAIRGLENVRVILKVASYQMEIKKQLLDINDRVEIVE